MDLLHSVQQHENISISSSADYTNQEYILVAAVVEELRDEGLIPSKKNIPG